MSYKIEFETVELILLADVATSNVDAFALSLIKVERQMRKLITYLIFQSPEFIYDDRAALIKTLAANKQVYFDGTMTGFDAISPCTLMELIGPEHDRLRDRIRKFESYRNKIFHGQLTGEDLNSRELRSYVDDLKLWAHQLSESANRELGYDGFARNSFRKADLPALYSRLKAKIDTVDQYTTFIQTYMVRKRI